MEGHHEIIELIEREEELKCYDSLYNNKLLQLQRSLQKKRITSDEYEVSRKRIITKIKQNTKEKNDLTKSINSKIMSLKNIQSDVIKDWLFENE